MEKDFRLNFEMKGGGDSTVAFEKLKQLQAAGIADETATITLNGVRIPAGCLETAEELVEIYGMLVNKNRDGIRDFALDHAISMVDYQYFLCECNRALNNGKLFAEDEDDYGFTPTELDDIENKAESLIAQQDERRR